MHPTLVMPVKYEITGRMGDDVKYTIRLDSRTLVTVLEHQLFKTRWIEHFGSVDEVLEFIKNYER